MRKSRLYGFFLFGLSVLSMLPMAAKDLPFAPARKKPTNPIVFIPSTNEALTAKLDMGWKLADQLNEPKKLVIMKFIPPDGTNEYSTKMINFVSYLDEPGKETAHEFMLNSKKSSEKLAPKGSLFWNVVSEDSPNECIWELQLKGWKEVPDQFEVERVIRGKDGMHAVIYHLDRSEVTENERQQILSWLKTVKLVGREEFMGTKGGASAALQAAIAK